MHSGGIFLAPLGGHREGDVLEALENLQLLTVAQK